MPLLRIYSKLYLEQEDESWAARPNIPCMLELPRTQESARWIAHLRSGDEHLHIALGDPVLNTAQNPPGLYVPSWCLNSLGLCGDGEEVLIDFVRCEDFEKATRLVFKVLGGPVDEIMLRDILEESLSQVGVVEEGQMIPLPMMEGVVLLTEVCEPGGAVFLDGNEVALEISQSRPATPEPEMAPVSVPVFASASAEQEQEQEQELQSHTGPMIPLEEVSTPTPRSRGVRCIPFIPFSGAGRSLGNS